MAWLDDVKAVFDRYGIPDYIWRPIARQESGLNPAAHNGNGEDSWGLFQINIQANPAFAGYNLTDPVVNAQIAAEHFIKPAYDRIRWAGDPATEAAYVWREGIRPNWQSVQSRGADLALMTEAQTIAAGGGKAPTVTVPIIPGLPGIDVDLSKLGGAGNVLTGEFWSKAGLYILFALLLVIMFAGGFWALAKAFGADSYITDGVKKAAKAVTI